MECWKCQTECPPGSKFCSQCGALLRSSGDTTKVIPVQPDDTGVLTELDPAAAAAVSELPPGVALLVVERGSGVGARYLLDSDVVTVGRHPDSDIFLDDITVSRHHAKFVRAGGTIRVEDLGSLNGTYINRNLVDDGAPLKVGDEVQIGKFRLSFFVGERGAP